MATVSAVAKAAAKLLKCKPAEVFQALTGVIGEPLDPAHIVNASPRLIADAQDGMWKDAARAIMTPIRFRRPHRAVFVSANPRSPSTVLPRVQA